MASRPSLYPQMAPFGEDGKTGHDPPSAPETTETDKLVERGPSLYVLGKHCSQHIDAVLREVLVDGKLFVDGPISTLADLPFRHAAAPLQVFSPFP